MTKATLKPSHQDFSFLVLNKRVANNPEKIIVPTPANNDGRRKLKTDAPSNLTLKLTNQM